MNLKGSKTESNLKRAFAGESQACNKYTYFANKALAEGYDEIADILLETARNEQAHAKLWFDLLYGEQTTKENLVSAIEGEHEEWTSMYALMANDAKEEGFMKLAYQLEQVAKIEKLHEDRFHYYLKELENDELLHKEESVNWVCPICGYLHEGKDAINCPVCGTKASKMRIENDNWK